MVWENHKIKDMSRNLDKMAKQLNGKIQKGEDTQTDLDEYLNAINQFEKELVDFQGSLNIAQRFVGEGQIKSLLQKNATERIKIAKYRKETWNPESALENK